MVKAGHERGDCRHVFFNALVRKAGLLHHEGQVARKGLLNELLNSILEQFGVKTYVNTSSAIGTT
jgi:hypothetical protein